MNIFTAGGNTVNDLLENGLRIFGARIIGGDDHHICKAGGNRPHLWPLAAITISAAAKNTDKPTARQLLQCLQHIFQGIGRMGIIDKDRRSH